MLHIEDKDWKNTHAYLGWKRCLNCRSDYYVNTYCFATPEPTRSKLADLPDFELKKYQPFPTYQELHPDAGEWVPDSLDSRI